MTSLPAESIEIVAAHFAGKRLEDFLASVDVLNEAIANGAWLPKRGRAQALKGFGKGLTGSKAILQAIRSNHDLTMLILYGRPRPNADLSAPVEGLAPELVQAWADVCYAAHAAVRELDQARPKPVLTPVGLSPRVTATLTEIGLDIDLATIAYPKLEKREREARDKDGRLITIRYYEVVWPADTVHGASRFASSSRHCEACGKRIPSRRFVPMYAHDRKRGKPVSLWLGRDCARQIFGISDVGLEQS